MTKKLLIIVAALALALAACGGDDSDDSSSDTGGTDSESSVAAPDVGNGEKVFESTCVACHGPGGEGIDGLGKPMPGSAFIDDSSDADLIAFIKVGRGTGDPANTTGVDMPAKGGNPSLDEQDLVDVVAFIRTLG
jgi:disulfide bond formation protein DsbB